MSISVSMPSKFLLLTRIAVEERLARLEAENASDMTPAERDAWDDEHAYGNDLPIYRMIQEILTEALEADNAKF